MSRTQRRLLRHHVPIAILSALLIVAIFALIPSPNDKFRLSMATAYTGLLLLGATLLTGPLNVLLKRANPVSTDLRRDIGVWSAIVIAVYVVVGVQIHMGNALLYFFTQEYAGAPLIWRTDIFGLANDTGLVASLVILMLLALSNDLSLRLLGKGKWKNLQRLSYLGFWLVIAHGVIYQSIENRRFPFTVAFAAATGIVVVTQIAGLLLRMRQRSISRAVSA